MYAVYHGPEGLKRIARRVASYTAVLAAGLEAAGPARWRTTSAFDTLEVATGDAHRRRAAARACDAGCNLRRASATQRRHHARRDDDARRHRGAVAAVRRHRQRCRDFDAQFENGIASLIPTGAARTSAFLTHPVFNRHHSETEMLRYLRSLADKDLALDRTMIPLGSCTMKLNATSEMIPITWPEFAQHASVRAARPAAPATTLLRAQLEAWLCEATGYAGVSLQPNAGSQGEYAGLLVDPRLPRGARRGAAATSA